jgi:putative aldouronate transport system permease protein
VIRRESYKGEGLKKKGEFTKNFRRDWQLHLFMLLPMIYLLIFAYYPMFGIQIAFKNFQPAKGIFGSPWAGFRHFRTFFDSYQFIRVVRNTLSLSFYSLAAGFPLPIIFALLLNVVRNRRFKKFVQTITYVPHFISIVVVVGILNRIFSPINGAYGYIAKLLSGTYPEAILGRAETFRHFYVWSGIWQEMGWNTVIYIAALSAVNTELYEAATIDGASRFRCLIHIDFPTILPTTAMLLILRFGYIMSVGYEKTLLMQTSLNLDTAEIISTYVYKVGLQTGSNFSYATAIGLFNSVINCAILLLVNKTASKLSSGEYGLF